MKTASLLVSMWALLGACSAPGGEETRTITLSHLEPGQALELVEPYVGSLQNVRAMGPKSGTGPAVLTITAPTPRIEQIEALLRRYDVPAPMVRLRFQVIEADGFAQTDTTIADVENALRELFRFRGYRAVADAFATGRPWSTTTHRLIGPRNIPLVLDVEIGDVAFERASGGGAADTADTRRAVTLNVQLRAGNDVILSSGVTVPHGQTVVLGTARPFTDMGALILVVRPEMQ